MSKHVSSRKSAPKDRKSAPVAKKSATRRKVITRKSAPKARRPVVVVSLDPRVVVLEQLAGKLRRDALSGTRPTSSAVELKRGLQAVLGLMDDYPDSPVLDP